MSDPDSLVATRARRANAGSRLKQLIEIEEQATGVSNIVYSEDDENVQLLFQEDENDEEFEESDANESGSEEEGDEEEEDEENGDRTGVDDSSKENKTSDIESAVNSDEMLSDSDISASENDDSEGERELQKNEKEKKRKTKPSSIIPAIKKPKLSTAKPKPKPKAKHSELLLNLDRRASSRKSAMRNKEILVQKLKEDETRRAALTPIVRVDEVQLTQEDRLAQAVETEKENVLSLHSFLEQEIVKKEHQKLLFQQRRTKLRNVIRILSRETFVAPIDEIEDARHVQELFDKKKNKGRRRKNAPEVPEEPRPGDIDTELPYYKKEMEEKRIREEKEAAEREKIERELEEKRRLIAEEEEKRRLELEEEQKPQNIVHEEGTQDSENAEGAGIAEGTDNENKDSISGKTQPPETEDIEDLSNKPIPEDSATKSPESVGDGSLDIENIEDDKEEEEQIAIKKETIEEEEEKGEVISEPNPRLDDSDEAKSQEDTKESNLDKEEDDALKLDEKSTELEKESHESGSEILTSVPIEVEDEALTKDSTPLEQAPSDERKVKFADSEGVVEEPQVEEVSEEIDESDEGAQTKSSYRASKDGVVFEGPVQQVGRNHIILMNFDEEQYPYLSEPKIKTILFGDEANLGASRRFRDVKTILKSTIRSDNPYTAPREEKEDDLMKPVTEITEDDTMFEALRRLPRLGIKETFEVEEEDVQKEEATEIQIRTEAPSGLYLPNGNKKLCLISGREVRYFDPATGLPYENKDVYKTIKTIEQGLIPWYSIGKDQNAYGEIEIYLNHREGSRHAKGVPEGFDGC